MNPNRDRFCLSGVILLLNGLACDDAVVGRRLATEFQTTTNIAAGAAAATGDQLSSGGASSAHAAHSSQAVAGTASLGDCSTGISVHPSTGVCTTEPAMGDVDCNGVVDIVDALKLAQQIENVRQYPLYEPAGDLNCDGCLTKDDATLISEISAGSFDAHDCAD